MHEGDTIGIFQIESAAQIQTIRRIKPVNLVDMAYEVACVRPGVGVNDGVSQFIRRRNGENWEFDHELEISFNSRYLIDVASQLDGDHIEIYLKDTGSPALIKDPGDFDSIFVVMPMKG